MATQQQGSVGGRASAQSGHGKVSASEIEKYLSGVDFPCDKSGLISHARDKNAPQEVIDVMEDFPDKQYGDVADVAKGIGQAKH